MAMLADPLRNPNMSGRVESTFGPVDYIAGAFPIGRYLAPLAQKAMTALGFGDDAGVNLAREAFSRRFGTKARIGDRAFEKELRATASPYEMKYGGPYSGMDIPNTSEIMGTAIAPPPRTIKMPSSNKVSRQQFRFGQEMKELDQVKNLVDNPDEFRRAYDMMDGGYPDFDGGYYVDEAADEITRMAGMELGFLDDLGNPTKAFDDILVSEDIAAEALMNLRYPPKGSNKVFNDPTQAAFEAGNIARARGASPEAQRMAIDRALKMAKRRLDYEKAMAQKPKPKPKSPQDRKAIDEMHDLLRQMLGDK